MVSLCDLANQAMTSGYLSLSAEKQLRRLLSQSYNYNLEDFDAFMKLQVAAMEGRVLQESREKKENCLPSVFK